MKFLLIFSSTVVRIIEENMFSRGRRGGDDPMKSKPHFYNFFEISFPI